MKIRRNTIFNLRGKKAEIKAYALIIFLKKRVGICAYLSKFSINKIAKAASVSPNTIKKYLPIWVRLGLVERYGKNKDNLIIKRFSARKEHRNFDISDFDMSSFKSTYYSLRSFIFLTIQAQKEYVKRMIRTATDPKDFKEFKKARKFCNQHAHKDNMGRYVFKENGISYKYIGKVVGFCERTAERIVQFAIRKKWCKKETHFSYTYMPGICFREVNGYTFTTWNYGYVVGANTYVLSELITGKLLDGKM